MTKKETQIEELEGHIILEARIECDKCNKTDSIDELDPENDAYRNGWRIDEDICYCPSCAKKYLKPNKK